MDRQVVAARVLHAPQVQDLRAAGGHLQHVLVADAGDPPRGGHDPRVGGEHPVDIGVDLAHLRAQRRRQRDRRGVRPAAAQRGDVLAVLGHPLEAGDDGHRALVEGLPDPARGDVDDAGPPVCGVGDDPGLAAGERPGLLPQGGDSHGQQRHGDPLAGGEQHVQLPPGGQRGHLLGQVEELVGGVAHGRDHDDHVVPGLAGLHDPGRHPLDRGRIRHGRAAVLLHDEAHGQAPPVGTYGDSGQSRRRPGVAARRPRTETARHRPGGRVPG